MIVGRIGKGKYQIDVRMGRGARVRRNLVGTEADARALESAIKWGVGKPVNTAGRWRNLPGRTSIGCGCTGRRTREIYTQVALHRKQRAVEML